MFYCFSEIFLELLNHSAPEKEKVRIIRVFSSSVEKRDYPGPELDQDVFVPVNASAQCEKQHEKYSLHHMVRRRDRRIVEVEERFKSLHKQNKIASFNDIIEYRKLISEAEQKVLTNGVNIVLCTCNEAGSRRLTSAVQPKYCIIDECAMATEPECMVPIRRAEHVVLIGDHQQLQPVIQCKEAENMGLGKSLFERYASKKYKIHVLETQYRMVRTNNVLTVVLKYFSYFFQHPEICDFPSRAFYEGKLQTDPSVMRRRSGFNLAGFWPQGEGCPIVFCQVEGEEETGYIGSKGNNKVDSQSKFNTTEAKKIVSKVYNNNF